MKKKIMAAALAALTMMGSMAAEAARGVVALIADDKIIVQTDDILEEYTGATTFETYKNYNEGDVIYGDFNSYGRSRLSTTQEADAHDINAGMIFLCRDDIFMSG